MPIEAVSCSRNVVCSVVNAPTAASSITALTWPSNSTGSTMMLRGCCANSAERIGATLSGTSLISNAALVCGALADEPFADAQARRVAVFAVVGVSGEQAQPETRPRR